MVLGVVVLLGALITISADTWAAQLSSNKLDVVRLNCVQSQVLIQQIQYNDAATRVNRGQAYEALLSDLINPLNSRLAAAGYNSEAADLTTVATNYQKNLTKFKSDYETYDDSLSAVLRTKCRDKPQVFYDNLQEARLQRQTVSEDIKLIAQIIDQYQSSAAKLKETVR